MEIEPRDEVDEQLNQHLAEQSVEHDTLLQVINETERFHQNQCDMRFAQAIEQSKAEIATCEQLIVQNQSRIEAVKQQLGTIPANLLTYEAIEHTGVGKPLNRALQALSVLGLTILAAGEIQFVPNLLENAGFGTSGIGMLLFGLMAFAVSSINAANTIWHEKQIDTDKTASILKVWLIIHMTCLCGLFLRPNIEIQPLLTEIFPTVAEELTLMGTGLEIAINLVWLVSMVLLVQFSYLLAAAGVLAARKNNRLVNSQQNPAFLELNYLVDSELASIANCTQRKGNAEATMTAMKAITDNIVLAAKTDLIHRHSLIRQKALLQTQLEDSEERAQGQQTQNPLTLVR